MSNTHIIDFSDDFNELANELASLRNKSQKVEKINININSEISDLWLELGKLPNYTNKHKEKTSGNMLREKELDDSINKMNTILRDLDTLDLRGDIKLIPADIYICTITGILASLIDIFLVGVPKNPFKSNKEIFFDDLIAKIGNNESISKILLELSKKSKVSYDISIKRGIVYPKNHRLRSFAHDPMFGLLFAIFDLKMGTCTLIDNNGRLKIIPNKTGNEAASIIVCIVTYIGHILSDVNTSQGIAIPGFVFTQFVVGNDNSFANICEKMYVDGYDLRHLASMSVPVFVKNLMIEIYYRFFKHENIDLIRNISEKEIDKNYYIAYKYRLLVIVDCISCIGNVIKFFIPLNNGNITAINMPEWINLMNDSLTNIKYKKRDKKIEKILLNREIINENWIKLVES